MIAFYETPYTRTSTLEETLADLGTFGPKYPPQLYHLYAELNRVKMQKKPPKHLVKELERKIKALVQR
jgi:hypothetical protein